MQTTQAKLELTEAKISTVIKKALVFIILVTVDLHSLLGILTRRGGKESY